jgi:hypothetical protein
LVVFIFRTLSAFKEGLVDLFNNALRNLIGLNRFNHGGSFRVGMNMVFLYQREFFVKIKIGVPIILIQPKPTNARSSSPLAARLICFAFSKGDKPHSAKSIE